MPIDIPAGAGSYGPPNGIRTLADFGPKPPQLTVQQVIRLASLDLRSRTDLGAIRGMVHLNRGKPGATWQPLLERIESAASQHADNRRHAPAPDFGLPPRATNPERLSPAELELLRRFPEPSKLTDAEIDTLLDMQSRTDGADLQVVERALGDAAAKRFARRKAEHVKDIRSRQPQPAGADRATRQELEDLLVERIIESDEELRQVHAISPGVAEREAKALAKTQLDEAVAGVVSEWEAKVAQAEAMELPRQSAVSGMEAGRRLARQQRAARPPAGSTESLRSA